MSRTDTKYSSNTAAFEASIGIGTALSIEGLRAMAEDSTMDFAEHAACKSVISTEDFYPARGQEMPQHVLACCKGCGVRLECFAFGLAHEDFGIWGGASVRQRHTIARRIGIARQRPEAWFHTQMDQDRKNRVRALNAAQRGVAV